MKALKIIRIIFAAVIAVLVVVGITVNVRDMLAQKEMEREIIDFVDSQQEFVNEITQYLECDRKDIYQSRLDESETAIEKLNSFESMLSYIEDSYVKMSEETEKTGLNSENKEDYERQKKNQTYSAEILEVRAGFNEIRDKFQTRFMGTAE